MALDDAINDPSSKNRRNSVENGRRGSIQNARRGSLRHSVNHQHHHHRRGSVRRNSTSLNNDPEDYIKARVDAAAAAVQPHQSGDNPTTSTSTSTPALSWADSYALERTKTPATPVVQNLLHLRHSMNPEENSSAALRSRRATAGIKCPQCGKVGYYRVNCPDCQSASPVKIDVINDSWQPTTPPHIRQQRQLKAHRESAETQIEQSTFKKVSEVKTKSGLGGSSWFWKKDEVVWQYDEEVLPEAYNNKSKDGKVGRQNKTGRGGGGDFELGYCQRQRRHGFLQPEREQGADSRPHVHAGETQNNESQG